MKRLKLKALSDIDNVLTREELKLVFGGSDSGSNDGSGGSYQCCIAINADNVWGCATTASAAEYFATQKDDPTLGKYGTWGCNTEQAYSRCYNSFPICKRPVSL